ncbi:MAG: hypothetical protein ACXAD7_24605 [Candidatus Kariarchaeaceae archaeon]
MSDLIRTMEEHDAFADGTTLEYDAFDIAIFVWVVALVLTPFFYFGDRDLPLYYFPIGFAILGTIYAYLDNDEFTLSQDKTILIHNKRLIAPREISLLGLKQISMRAFLNSQNEASWECYLEFYENPERKILDHNRFSVIDLSVALSRALETNLIFQEFDKDNLLTSEETYKMIEREYTPRNLLKWFHEPSPIEYARYTCQNCNRIIKLKGNKCPKCKTRAPICVICYRDPEPDELVSLLSCCGSYIHTTHVRSWLKSNKRCPYCQTFDPEVKYVTEPDEI